MQGEHVSTSFKLMSKAIKQRSIFSFSVFHKGMVRHLNVVTVTCLAVLGISSAASVYGQADGVPKSAPTVKVQAQQTFNVTSTVSHALSLFGDVKYPKDFQHFDYVNPNAPKGGRIRLSAIGGFDSFNPFIVKGEPANGLGFMYDTLLTGSSDEASTDYGLLAEKVEVPEDYSWVTYTLRAEARFHDGTPVTAEDVIFSLNVLKEKGQPLFRFYYANIEDAKALDARTVKFIFNEAGNRELPQITGQLPVFPKHYWDGRDFAQSTLDAPLSSGPYRIKEYEVNRYIALERVPDYWGADLPVNKGRYNFDEIRFDYYRDTEVTLTAFFADEFDVRLENTAKNWATKYDVPMVESGQIRKLVLEDKIPARTQAFFFNLRKDKFQDRRVREAIGLAFNFEWLNKFIFFDQYLRINSFFEKSELAAKGLPQGAELAFLGPYRGQLPKELFTEEFRLPETDGSGTYRKNLVRALELLREAGWSLIDGKMTDDATGEELTIEFLLVQPGLEKVVQPFLRDLERIGITGSIRIVGSAQYERRLENRDFDMIIYGVQQSLSPGNEQREYWGSEAADRPGSRNLAGIKNPIVDALIEEIIFAKDRAELVAASQAMDRVLLWQHYLIPQWYSPGWRYAIWDRVAMPKNLPPYTPGDFTIWWSKDAGPDTALPGNDAEGDVIE